MNEAKNTILPINQNLLTDLRELIVSAKEAITLAVNSGMSSLYWQIGNRIRLDILQNGRGAYGEEVVQNISRQLESEFGRGFSVKSVRRMIQFSEIYPEQEIVASLMRQLSWTHFTLLIPIEDPLKRSFYAEMCRSERWSVRTLRERIDSMLFERTALSRQPEEAIRSDLQTLAGEGKISSSLVLKDPYVLDFLGLKDRYLEKDLEDAVLRELEGFLLELGAGFTFVERQKRLVIDNEDFYIDLLLYNRKLNRLVAVELKLGEFKAAYKGQMELYLRWLAKYEQEKDEQPPLGIILCSGKKQEQIELLELDGAGIHVAEYLTVLPPRDILEKKLHEAVENSRKRISDGASEPELRISEPCFT